MKSKVNKCCSKKITFLSIFYRNFQEISVTVRKTTRGNNVRFDEPKTKLKKKKKKKRKEKRKNKGRSVLLHGSFDGGPLDFLLPSEVVRGGTRRTIAHCGRHSFADDDDVTRRVVMPRRMRKSGRESLLNSSPSG